jgi:hypothetical protein
MIRPSIGRVMWYWPEISDRTDQPYDAHVCYVHDDNMVNLVVFDHHGQMAAEIRVPIVQDGGPNLPTDGHYCEWMPFQKGQAAKTEALESARSVPTGNVKF